MENYWEKVFQESNNYYTDMDNPSRKVIVDYIHPTDSVLDLGCGGGALKALLPDNKYLGVDYSETAIKLARERYSASEFAVADARNLSSFKDNEFDVVVMRHFLENQENWRKAVEEAFRICNKKVILVARRITTETPTTLIEQVDDTWVWDINFDEFNMLARHLSVNVSYGKVGNEDLIIIGKHLNDAVFDLDDLYDGNHNLDKLFELKEKFPKLKVTMFCIPSKGTKGFFEEFKFRYPWMELAVHGWLHDTRGLTAQESNFWTKEEANKYLQQAEDMGVFVKGFRAPGWNINHETYEVLRDRGYWVADHKDHDQWKDEIILPRYTTGHLWEVHGHIQNVNMNGLEELATTKLNFGDNTNFHFVSEVVGDNNYLPNAY